jgi:large subunit ribosomal protein L10
MAKTKQQKQDLVDKYATKISDSNALIVITPTKITPNEATQLRKKLHKTGATFSVVKNTLFKVALEKANKELKDIDFNEENAIVFCSKDVSEVAKIVNDTLEEIKKGEIKGGLLEDTPLNKEEVDQLAKLPSKDIMIATTVRVIAAPLSNFVHVLNGNILNLVNVIKNIAENKE